MLLVYYKQHFHLLPNLGLFYIFETHDFPFTCRVVRTRSKVIASHFSTCDGELLLRFVLMTSVRVTGSHSFGKIVNKRHFVQRFISWISSKKARFCSSSCHLHCCSRLVLSHSTFFFGGGEKRL